MHLIKGNTLSNAVLRCYDTILEEGYYSGSRNGGATALYDVTVEMTNARSRHLYLNERKSNIFQMIAETFWVMSGSDELFPYLDFFLPRAKEYSDDGKTWSGAYGPRLYAYDQLKSMVELFRLDGINTRRAVTMIHDPSLDSSEALADRFGEHVLGKDRPCNLLVNFYVEQGRFFCTKVIQRSGDIIFGTGSINPFEFSFLHELMYNEVKKVHPELILGPYRWHVTNMHLYDFSKAQAVNAVADDENWGLSILENNDSMTGPSIQNWKPFFSDLVSKYTEAIISANPKHYHRYLVDGIEGIFSKWGVPTTESNLLWQYAKLVAHYIAEKRGAHEVLDDEIDLTMVYEEFRQAIVNSPFRKFDVIH